MNPNFFVEFQFDNELTTRSYWLPLFLIANSPDKANTISNSVKTALEEHFKNVRCTIPIPKFESTKQYIAHKFDMHRSYKLAILTAHVWKFEDAQPDLSFNEQLDFIADIRPLVARDLATLIASHKFPVRIVREGKLAIDFEEFLLINLVA